MSHRNAHLSMVIVFGIMALLTIGARPKDYLICHKSGGKKPTYKRKSVSEPVLKGHLRHGDHMWEEEDDFFICEDGIDNDCDGVIDMNEPTCPYEVCWGSCFYEDFYPCEDACYYEVLADCTGGNPECFFDDCPPECLELKDACVAECQADYESCISGCPAAP